MSHGRIYHPGNGIRHVLFDIVIFLRLSLCTLHPFLTAFHEIQIFKFGTKEGKAAAVLPEEHSYILQPVTGNAKYSKQHASLPVNDGQPLQKAVVNLDDVTLSLSKVGGKSPFFIKTDRIYISISIFILYMLSQFMYVLAEWIQGSVKIS